MNLQVPQSWGEYSLQLELPAANVCLTGLSSRQLASLKEAYPGFIAQISYKTSEYDIECRACKLEQALTISSQELTADDQYAPRKVRRLDAIELTGANFEAQFPLISSPKPASLAVLQENELAQAIVIENFLRIFAAHRALEQGGMVLHSAGLVFDGQAYIFSGRSNAGKTTLTRKAYARGAWVLSDDINLLLPDEKGYQAYAVPFTGEFGRTLEHLNGQKSYPVAGIVLLEQADQLETSVVRSSSAVARLLTACPFVNTDPAESAVLFDVITNLVAKLPVIRLKNRRDDDIENIMQLVKNELNDARSSE